MRRTQNGMGLGANERCVYFMQRLQVVRQRKCRRMVIGERGCWWSTIHVVCVCVAHTPWGRFVLTFHGERVLLLCVRSVTRNAVCRTKRIPLASDCGVHGHEKQQYPVAAQWLRFFFFLFPTIRDVRRGWTLSFVCRRTATQEQ